MTASGHRVDRWHFLRITTLARAAEPIPVLAHGDRFRIRLNQAKAAYQKRAEQHSASQATPETTPERTK
jgi:hypothetical protein